MPVTKASCLRCGYNHERLDIIKQHLSRKKICQPTRTNASIEQCKKALKDPWFAFNFAMKEIEKLKKISINNNITAGDNCTINNTVNNITLNLTLSYENTNYDLIKDQIPTCIKNNKIDKEKLLKLIHCNKQYPQNQNVMIQNRDKKRILAYDGTDFAEIGEGNQGIYDFIENLLNKTLDITDENDERSQLALDNTLNDHADEKFKDRDIQKATRQLYNVRHDVIRNVKKI